MQFAHPPTTLPSNEYDRLQRLMLTMIGSRSTLASMLRRKLGAVEPVSADEVDRNIALSGTRVRFHIDAMETQERLLTWQPSTHSDTVHLSLLSPRGLALLGLSPGQSVSYRTDDDRTEFLEVDHVSGLEPNRLTTSPLRDMLRVATSHIGGTIAGVHYA